MPDPSVWIKLNMFLNVSQNPLLTNLAHIHHTSSQEKHNNGLSIDPISNKEMCGSGRRLFFVKEWERHLHLLLLEHASKSLGLPYSQANYQLTNLNLKHSVFSIQLNLNHSSIKELKLIQAFQACSTQAQRDNIYSLLLLLFAVNINCLRPQTGTRNIHTFPKTLLKHVSSLDTLRTLI